MDSRFEHAQERFQEELEDEQERALTKWEQMVQAIRSAIEAAMGYVSEYADDMCNADEVLLEDVDVLHTDGVIAIEAHFAKQLNDYDPADEYAEHYYDRYYRYPQN